MTTQTTPTADRPSIPARRSPDGYFAQQFTHPSGESRWYLLSATEYGPQMNVLTDDDVADWPVLGEVLELDSTPTPTVDVDHDQVLVVVTGPSVPTDRADEIRALLTELLGVADVVIISGADAITGAPAAEAGR